jgi:TPR repeat protein
MKRKFDDSLVDATIWSALEGSGCVDDFITYVRHLPKGVYVEEAFAAIDRLNDLNGGRTEPGNPCFPIAIEKVKELAEAGDITARFHLAKIYDKGHGVPEDPVLARKLYRMAAALGDFRSRYNLGINLLYGDTKEDIEEGELRLGEIAAEGDGDALALLASKRIRQRKASEDCSREIADLFAAWESGSAAAAYDLSSILDAGIGIPSSTTEALHWLKLSAEGGYCAARIELARRFLNGIGVPKDFGEALNLLRPPAEEGNVTGQAWLGLLLLDDENRGRDPAEGFKWLKRAALLGDLWAQFNLAITFMRGRDVIKNLGEAQRWLERAAAGGYVNAQYELAMLLSEETGEHEDDAKAKARALFRKAAERGHPNAQYYYGLTFAMDNLNCEREPIEARKWLRLAGVQGIAGAWTALGDTYWKRKGRTADDIKTALRYFRRGADGNCAIGQFRLGQYHYYAPSPDYPEAAYWLSLAAENGDPSGQFLLGEMLREGKGLRRDPVAAHRWLLHAAGNGDAAAMYSIGILFEQGDGVARSQEEAISWIKKARDAGFSAAREWLDIWEYGTVLRRADEVGRGVVEASLASKNAATIWFP